VQIIYTEEINFFLIAKHIITYIALRYLQNDTILHLLTIHYIIVIIIIIIIIIIISNAFTVLQTSLTIHEKDLFALLDITLLTYNTQLLIVAYTLSHLRSYNTIQLLNYREKNKQKNKPSQPGGKWIKW